MPLTDRPRAPAPPPSPPLPSCPQRHQRAAGGLPDLAEHLPRLRFQSAALQGQPAKWRRQRLLEHPLPLRHQLSQQTGVPQHASAAPGMPESPVGDREPGHSIKFTYAMLPPRVPGMKHRQLRRSSCISAFRCPQPCAHLAYLFSDQNSVALVLFCFKRTGGVDVQ